MIKKNKILRSSLLLSFWCLSLLYAGTPPTNLFNPYDVLLVPHEWPGTCWQFTVAVEEAYKIRAFLADDDQRCNTWRKCANVLQLWQDEQDALAAVKGDDFTTQLGEFAQLFNIDDDNGREGLFVPTGKMHIQNFMFSARYALGSNGTFGIHLPVYRMELNHVRWGTDSTPELITALENIGNINLGSWKRTGVGDLAGIFYWYGDYPQAKAYLRNVRLSIRAGLTFPTGKRKDEDKLLAIPFGYDGSVGALGGAGIELWFCNSLHGGIDAEFLQVFGKMRNRRIKTDPAQTDLLFLTKVQTFKEPGFLQHYTLYAESAYLWRGLSGKLAYQYTKQHDDKLSLCSDHFDPIIANSAESLWEWSTHSFIVNLTYDFYTGQKTVFKPFVSLFYKHGFNGKRALLADTITVAFSLSF